MKKCILTLTMLLLSLPAMAELRLFACEPEWAALSKELGGEKLTIYTATSGLQDPHYIQARPSLIAKARRADVLVCTGAGLESGWLPLLQRKSGNSAIQVGGKGYFMASDYVKLAEVPVTVDRSQGHIHAAGNPHIQTSPLNILKVAEALAQRLQALDRENSDYYKKRWEDFNQSWQAAIEHWQQQAAPLKNIGIVVQHDNWIYMTQWLGMKTVAILEPKPGVPPGIDDLQNVVNLLKTSPAKMVIRAAYQSSRASDWLAEKTGLPEVVLPFTVGGDKESKDLFSLFDNTIKRLLGANS